MSASVMDRCQTITKSGRQCKNRATRGTCCGIHHQEQDPVIRCQCVQRNGLQCRSSGQHQINGDWMCERHYQSYVRQVEQRAAENMLQDVLQDLIEGVNLHDLEERIDHGFIAGFYNQRHRNVMLEILHHEHAWMELDRQFLLNNVPPVNIAEDPQNVHRAEVSDQTNQGLSILLKFQVPSDQDVMRELQIEPRVRKDMLKWYKQPNCREDGDWLYKRTLDGVWAYIKQSEHKDELTRRLCEESKEALGMCCDGHITRLVNVLVGFDERVAPPVPVGELLQQRIALISEKDISLHEKVIEALVFMQELNVDMDDQRAWIEAL
jgi:hypothetical protein